ncbi:MAG: cysteine synthase A [Clostridia bacterium]|nr:cysteine synthase A [Clostridia bacterium]
MIYKSIDELIGHTPLVELSNLEKELSLKSKLIAKIELFNPAGSSKDRVAKEIIDSAENKGLIKVGDTIIEATSGNTGIALAMIGASRGYKVVIVMPDSMSKERISIMKAYGAEVILTPARDGMNGAVSKAQEIKENTAGAFIASQFENMSNPEAHFLTTGPEIYESTEGRVDIFVACIGTGGTVSGTGKYLKSKNPSIKVYGVEPEYSPLISKGVAGKHKIQGIGANFIPATYDKEICDEIITVKDEDAYDFARLISKKEGICVGISSGAAICAAVELAKKEENKNIVVLLPDTGTRYLSEGLFD